MVDLMSIHHFFPTLISLPPYAYRAGSSVTRLSAWASMSPWHRHHELETSKTAGESEFFRLAFPFSSLTPLLSFFLAVSVSSFAVPYVGVLG